jgi:V/A-type H+-transporting ATPase subunit F
MKVLVIGNPEAVLGFSLAGVNGQAASTVDEVNQALDDALHAHDIGIILITQDASAMVEPRMAQLRLRSTVPLVVEIPGPEGVRSGQPSLGEVVLRAIGIKL